MSKITTKNCKEKLVEFFPYTKENEWKRVNKYKGEDGFWIRNFENKEHGKSILLIEKNDELNIIQKLNTDYSFIMYKYDTTHFQWLVLFTADGEEDEFDNLKELLDKALEGSKVENKLDELDMPNYSCDDDDVKEIYTRLINNGFNYEKSLQPPQSIIFDESVFIKPEISNKIYSQYDIIKIIAYEKNGILPEHLYEPLKKVLSNLAKEEIQKFIFSINQLNISPESYVLKETNLELINRIANPKKIDPVSMTITEALRKKLGF